jgi:predicted lipoprotein with Yx(FWY)xxD motif
VNRARAKKKVCGSKSRLRNVERLIVLSTGISMANSSDVEPNFERNVHPMSNRSSSKWIQAQFIASLLLVTGYGYGLSTSTAQAQTTPSPTPSAAAGASNAVSLKLQTGSLDSYLVDSQGKSLYVFAADSANTSTCTGACAQVWPPLTVAQGQAAQAQTGVTSNLIGTITRSDGTQQVTYKGQPLYYYSLDQSAGQTNGQGITSFGAMWYLVKADGTPITSSSAAGSAAGTAAGTAGNSAACTYSTDAYGNMTYSSDCAGIAGTSAGCIATTDAFGNIIYSGSCAGTVPIVIVPGHDHDHDHNHNHDHDHMGN